MFLMIFVWAVVAVLLIAFFISFPPSWLLVALIVAWWTFRGWPAEGSRRMTAKEREALGPHIKERDE